MRTGKITTPVALLGAILLFACKMNAQTTVNSETKSRPYFSISAGGVHLNPAAKETTYQTLYYTLTDIPGTGMQREIRYNASFNVEHLFKAKWGGYLVSNIHFPLGRQLSLRTGLGVDFEQFTYEGKVGHLNLGTPIDTVVLPVNISNPITVYKYVQEASYIPNAPNDITYKLLALRVPILLEYQLPLNFSLEAGIFLHSLVWSQSSRYINQLRSERTTLADGKIQYTFYENTKFEKKTPAPSLTNAHAGWQIGMSYRLQRWAVEASYAKTFINSFVKDDDLSNYYYRTYNAKVINTYTRIGLCYFL